MIKWSAGWLHRVYRIDSSLKARIDYCWIDYQSINQSVNLLEYTTKRACIRTNKQNNDYFSLNKQYGSIVSDLSRSSIDAFCAIWRKGLRRIWNLPHTTHCALLPLLCGLLPLMDELACRCAIHSLMVASIVIVMLLILLHVTVSTLRECCLKLVGTLCSAAHVLVCDCLPLPI